ncbi:MAG: hypothetical protein PHV36_06650 [Elusimicrobiales bacterium]|nr:hypothetical protein [Elusimicrobiales bacterium]
MTILKFPKLFRRIYDNQRIAVALAKAAAAAPLRRIDETDPLSWEFSAFSQNGEDGIIDFLTRKLLSPNRYFIEIGACDGIENNTAWLAIARKYNGLMIEGDPAVSAKAKKAIKKYSLGVECLSLFVDSENISALAGKAFYKDPDVFSLDIDGMDYYVAEAVLSKGFKPKILVVEYNSVFGPDRAVTVPYRKDFSHAKAHPSELYFGVSVEGWRKALGKYGYQFLTVDSNGVNAFFINPAAFPEDFLLKIKGKAYAQNISQLQKFRGTWENQFSEIRSLPLMDIPG